LAVRTWAVWGKGKRMGCLLLAGFIGIWVAITVGSALWVNFTTRTSASACVYPPTCQTSYGAHLTQIHHTDLVSPAPPLLGCTVAGAGNFLVVCFALISFWLCSEYLQQQD
jgi:hypothetical protein